MKDYKRYIFPLLKKDKLPNSDFEEFKKSIKQLIRKVFCAAFSPQIEEMFKKAYGNGYLDDLFQEFLLRLFQTKDIILNLKFINEKYLFTIIQNIIYYHLSSGFRLIGKAKSFEELNPYSEEEENIKTEERIASQAYDYLKNLKIKHWFNELKNKLNEKDEETFCYYLFKWLLKKEMELKKINKNALYKRWERLKIKLQNILGAQLEEEDLEEIKELFEVYMSEVCQKKYFIKNKKG